MVTNNSAVICHFDCIIWQGSELYFFLQFLCKCAEIISFPFMSFSFDTGCIRGVGI